MTAPAVRLAPTPATPIVRLADGVRRGENARWGLVPHWFAKPIGEMKLSTFNARSEEVASKQTFRGALENRCLVPAIGYYKWTGPKGAKQPHFIAVERNAPASFSRASGASHGSLRPKVWNALFGARGSRLVGLLRRGSHGLFWFRRCAGPARLSSASWIVVWPLS